MKLSFKDQWQAQEEAFDLGICARAWRQHCLPDRRPVNMTCACGQSSSEPKIVGLEKYCECPLDMELWQKH